MKQNQKLTLNMVLTSLVNNQKLFDSVVDDVENRFKTKIDKVKLHAMLNVIDVEVKDEPIFV